MKKLILTVSQIRKKPPITESLMGFPGALFASLILILSLIGCSTSNSLHNNTVSRSQAGSLLIQQKPDDYQINAGDVIEIAVWRYDEFNTERTVSSRGFITVPLVGEIEARGLTKNQFTENLKEQLSEFIQGEINVSVSITNSQNNVVSVLGSVGRPDNYEIIDNATLFEILSRAGGTTDEADLRNITIYSKGGGPGSPIKIDLNRYLQGDDHPSTITPISPGDIVYVPREENMVRELSTFMRDVVLLFGMFRVFN